MLPPSLNLVCLSLPLQQLQGKKKPTIILIFIVTSYCETHASPLRVTHWTRFMSLVRAERGEAWGRSAGVGRPFMWMDAPLDGSLEKAL